jgi:hypothetical protein
MGYSSLTIITSNPDQTEHERETQRAKALAHAARVTHQRRVAQDNRGHHRTIVKDVRRQSLSTTFGDRRRAPSRSSILVAGQGNSDPFDAMPIRIKPETSHLPSLWQAHLSSNKTTLTMKINPVVYRDHLYVEGGLHLQCLLYIGSALLSLDGQHQQLQVQTLEHRLKCYRSLRTEIGQLTQSGDRNIFLKGLSLVLIATLLINERDEARIHAKNLYDGLSTNSPWLTERDRTLILCFVHYYDTVCAIVHLDSPVLDLKQLRRIWYNIDAVRGCSTEDLDSIEWWHHSVPMAGSVVKMPVFSQYLYNQFNMVQRFLNLQTDPLARMFKVYSTELPLKNAIGHSSITNALLENAARARAQYIASSGCSALGRGKEHAELVLSLAALAFFACRLTGPVIFSVEKMGRRAMDALRDSLEMDGNPMVHYLSPRMARHVRLWSLYIGSMWEWHSGRHLGPNAWFIPRLQQLVTELRLKLWSELVAICDGLLYFRPERIATTVWFLGMDWPSNVSWVGDSAYQTSGARFLEDLLFNAVAS